jgi:hypothetical protein
MVLRATVAVRDVMMCPRSMIKKENDNCLSL